MNCSSSGWNKKTKKEGHPFSLMDALFRYGFSTIYARSTAPERKQDVHTYIFFAPPATFTRTDFTFAFQILLERLCEWLTALPK